jgi:uncharacterized protein YbjT (DUF2867 family)
MRILVVGSTGTVGARVAQGLAGRGVSVRCMSRSREKLNNAPDGIETFVADLDRPHTLTEAFQDVDSLFLITPVSRNETEQGLRAVKSAKAAGIGKIVYLSVFMPPGAEGIPRFSGKLPVENAIRDSGIAYTILRPNHFFQNDLSLIGIIMGFGVYPSPVGKLGISRIDARDIGDAAVNALTGSGFEGQIYSLHGADALTGRDMARIYSKYAGRDVRYAGDDLDVWVKHVKGVMPLWLYSDMSVMYRYFQEKGMIAPQPDLERQVPLLGHEPRSFDAFAEQLSSEWKQSLACAA